MTLSIYITYLVVEMHWFTRLSVLPIYTTSDNEHMVRGKPLLKNGNLQVGPPQRIMNLLLTVLVRHMMMMSLMTDMYDMSGKRVQMLAWITCLLVGMSEKLRSFVFYEVNPMSTTITTVSNLKWYLMRVPIAGSHCGLPLRSSTLIFVEIGSSTLERSCARISRLYRKKTSCNSSLLNKSIHKCW